MSEREVDRLHRSLADRYRIERDLGQGGMAIMPATEVASRLMSLKRRVGGV